MEIKIKWIPRKQMTHENTYRDDKCDKNEWQPWNIRGSSVWKSEAANPYTGLNSLCKMSEIHKIGEVRNQIYQRIIFCGQLAGINLDSWTLDKLLFTNLIFLASKLEVPMINKKWSFLQACKFKKWLNLKENQQNYLYFSRRKTLWK